MKVWGTLRLFLHNAVWRVAGLESSGRNLLQALGSADENVRTLAGMFLVQAGPRAERLLAESLNARKDLPMVLFILGSIGNHRFEPELRRFSEDQDPQVARAARDALQVMSMQR